MSRTLRVTLDIEVKEAEAIWEDLPEATETNGFEVGEAVKYSVINNDNFWLASNLNGELGKVVIVASKWVDG